MKTSNPVLSDWSLSRAKSRGDTQEIMTIQGTVNKAAILIALLLIAASCSWTVYFRTHDPLVVWLTAGFGTVTTIIILAMSLGKMEWSFALAPLYAICEGLMLGGITAALDDRTPGIAVQAVLLTITILIGVLVAYIAGMIRVSEKFRNAVFAATFGILIYYLVSLILNMIGIHLLIHETEGVLGIIISTFIIIVAAMNLVLDFDTILVTSENGAPKYMEWFSAMSLLVTLAWLYIEVLRFLLRVKLKD